METEKITKNEFTQLGSNLIVLKVFNKTYIFTIQED